MQPTLKTNEKRILEQFANKNGADLNSIIAQRINGKPICKIIGEKGFYKYDFIVDENVLSPRPDTECLVEAAIVFAKKNNAKNILDLGLGSGCILLSIIADMPNLNGVGVDISQKALKIAEINAKNLKIEQKIQFINASWFDMKLEQKFDIITSNPPYITSQEMETLDTEVKDFDPLLALDGGIDGLRDYRQIAKIAKNLLSTKGQIFLEVGYTQAKKVIEIFKAQNYKHLQTINDLAGIERCVVFSQN